MWIMENDPECLYLTFSVDEEVFGMVSGVIISLVKSVKNSVPAAQLTLPVVESVCTLLYSSK